MRVPRWALTLIAVAVLAWVAGAEYSFHLNPEIVFFRSGDRLKQGWLRRVRASHTNVTCICGGSSVATSIEGKRLLERHGLPVVNLGLGAGMGAKVLSRYALDPVETGDTLLICLEPDLLGGTIELEPLGVQFALTIGRPALLREGRFTDWPSALLCLRPGGYHVITLAGKLASGRPLYRYAAREFQPDGTHVVEARLDFPAGEPVNLTRMFHTCLGGTGDSPVPPGHWPGGMRKARQRLACTHSHTASFPFRPASRRTEQAGGLFHPFWSLACELSGLRLSTDGRALLAFIRGTCALRGVRVAYSMPWHYCRRESAEALRRCHLRFLGDVSEILPVLKEPSLGVHSDRRHFADTNLHPTTEGAALRTDELAASLKTWGIWPPAELAAAGVALSNPAAKP